MFSILSQYTSLPSHLNGFSLFYSLASLSLCFGFLSCLPTSNLYSECMKTGSKFLGLCAIVGCGGLAHAQVWQPVRVDLLAPVSLVTTGGITYAEYTWGLGGCEAVDSIGPLIRNGSDFSFDFDIETETGVVCPEFIVVELNTVVLGALAPGDYTLTTTSWGMPVATNTFTIPTNSTPMLQPIGFAADGSFQIQLNGVTSVGYVVLQCSTNFVDWTSLSTNSVGEPLIDTSPVLPGCRFYRVQILQTVTPSPG